MTVGVWLSRHAQTLVGSLGRIAQHPGGALLTMAVIAVAIALPLGLAVVLDNGREATAHLNRAFDLSVYLDKKTPPSRTLELAAQWRARDDVAAVRVITADQAYADFRRESGFGKALDALGENPLPDTLVVTPAMRANTEAASAALASALANAPNVQSVQVDTAWVTRWSALVDLVGRLIECLAVLLGLGVVLVVGNTIRLDILNRREEIEVMKLVGASDGFARRPFLYSGIWYGLGSSLMALLVVLVAVYWVTGPIERLASLYGSAFRVHGIGLRNALTVIAMTVGLSWLGSWMSATRHIKRIEPT